MGKLIHQIGSVLMGKGKTMADIEKVIKTLQTALDNAEIDGTIYAKVRRPVVFDIINLLKKQEKSRIEIASEITQGSILMYQGKELVRCKDCVYSAEHCSYSVFGKPLYICNHVRQIGRDGLAIHTDNWFCADGERRSE